MSMPIGESEARVALHAIEQRRKQVIAEIDVPPWYWCAMAAGWVVLGVVSDNASFWAYIAATLVFGAAHASVAPRVLTGRRASSRVSVRGELADRRIPLVIIGLLVAMVAVTVALALLLHADGARHPATWASVVVAALLLVGGPALDEHRAPPGRPRLDDMTEARFDEIIHPSTRLSIVALLAATDWAEFSFVRDRLGLSDSALSKQFTTLEQAGYVAIERTVSNHRRRVRVSLTEAGRRAFEGHVAALEAVIANARTPA